ALVPPSLLAIPALFVVALLLRGQTLRAEALRQQGRRVPALRLMLPTLPMILLLFLVTWVVQAQDLLWQLISAPSRRYSTAPVLLTRAVRTSATRPDAMPFDLVLPIGLLVVLFLLAVAAQVGYLDRIALRVGKPERVDSTR